MDNFTHTLTGLVVAEAALGLRRSRGAKTAPAFVRAAWLTSALANNLPDADVLLAPLIEAPYGYLIHHRGHTHTFLLAPLLGLLCAGMVAAIARRTVGFTRSEHRLLALLGLLGGLIHIAMDATNTYGVHPFWPLDNQWYGLDLLFIVEPLWWLALAIPLSFSVTSPRARAALLALPALGIVLSIATGFVSDLAVAWLLAAAAGLYVLARRLKTAGGRATLSLFATFAMLIAFALGRGIADARVRTALDGAFSYAIEADVILMPEPGNPLCWNALSVSEERQDLVLRRVQVSSASWLHPVGMCRMPFADDTNAVRTPIARSETADIHFVDETRTPLEVLRALNETDCRAQTFFRFSRAPFYVEEEGRRLLGDLRYDRRVGGFALAELPQASENPQNCPENVPAWEPWRTDVLSGPLPEEIHRFESLDM